MPNFLCFVADQLRHDALACTGHPSVRTPHLDRLAAEGVRFTRCYSVHPLCMPTRATWLTGRTPRGHGTRCNGVPLDPTIPTFTEALRQAGYRTHAIGKIHANPWLPQQDYDPDQLDPQQWPEAIPLWERGALDQPPLPYYGFASVDLLCGWSSGHYGRWLRERCPNADELLQPPPHVNRTPQGILDPPETTFPSRLPAKLHYTQWASDCADRFFADLASTEQPFFLWLSIPDPHPPFSVAEPYYSMYRDAAMPEPIRREGELDDLPPHYARLYHEGLTTAGRIAPTKVDPELEREAARTICGIVTQWDDMVGRVLDHLCQHELADDTIIVVMSDHGQMLGDHWLHNMPPTHLDGTLRVPCIWHAPDRFGSPRTSDALVSHLDFAPTVLDLAGVPTPEGRTPPTPEAPAALPPWPGHSFAPILHGKTDAIQQQVIAENDEDYLGLRLRTLITERYHFTAYAGQPYGELYDLRDDPQQLHNRWDDPRLADTRADLHKDLFHQLALTDSTLPRRLGHA